MLPTVKSNLDQELDWVATHYISALKHGFSFSCQGLDLPVLPSINKEAKDSLQLQAANIASKYKKHQSVASSSPNTKSDYPLRLAHTLGAGQRPGTDIGTLLDLTEEEEEGPVQTRQQTSIPFIHLRPRDDINSPLDVNSAKVRMSDSLDPLVNSADRQEDLDFYNAVDELVCSTGSMHEQY